MSYHTGPPQQQAGSTFTTSVRGRKQKGRLRAGSLCGVSLLCSSVFCLAFSSACHYFTLITPNVPARLLCGPAVKKSWLVRPLLAVPPPKSIPHSWSMTRFLPFESLSVPKNWPEIALNALMVPLLVLLETRRALLNFPKFFGETA